MAFFETSSSTNVYFSPIFSRTGDNECKGKLCIVPPLPRRLSAMLPTLTGVVGVLSLVKIWSMLAPQWAASIIDLELVNVWVMLLSLVPGALTTWILILCQLRSVKSKVYYEGGQGTLRIVRGKSFATYATYALMLLNLALGCSWIHGNPRYHFEEIPFFAGIMALLVLIGIPMCLRLLWIGRKWSHPEIVWHDGPHF